MDKKSHCGVCTPMKMEAIRMISDILYEDRGALDIKILCNLAEESVPADLGPFIHELEQAVSYLEKNEKYKDKAKKLGQIRIQLLDTQEKIDRDELDVVAHKTADYESDTAQAHEEAIKAYKYLKSLIPDLEPEQAVRSADPRAKDPAYLDQYERWKKALPLAKLYGRLSQKEAATYDTWETDREWSRIFQERGGPGVSVFPHRDYPEDSRTFPREQTRPRHQQEHWRKKKELEEKKEELEEKEREKAEVGGEGLVPGAAPGSTYWRQSPTMFNAMPMDNTISLTLEFRSEGLKAVCTWDAEDLPEGLDEQQTLLRLIEFLELNIPEAMKKFKSITADDVDLTNRTVTLMVGK